MGPPVGGRPDKRGQLEKRGRTDERMGLNVGERHDEQPNQDLNISRVTSGEGIGPQLAGGQGENNGQQVFGSSLLDAFGGQDAAGGGQVREGLNSVLKPTEEEEKNQQMPPEV